MRVKRLVTKMLHTVVGFVMVLGLVSTIGGSTLVSDAQARGIPDRPGMMTFLSSSDTLGIEGMKDARTRSRLAHALTQLRLLLRIEEDRLLMADETVVDLQQLAAELQADGEDVTELEKAVADFATGVEVARASWGDASQILSSAAGFDTDAKVVDLDQAQNTIHEAKDAMKDCRHTLQDATTDLRRALRNYRQALGD